MQRAERTSENLERAQLEREAEAYAGAADNVSTAIGKEDHDAMRGLARFQNDDDLRMVDPPFPEKFQAHRRAVRGNHLITN